MAMLPEHLRFGLPTPPDLPSYTKAGAFLQSPATWSPMLEAQILEIEKQVDRILKSQDSKFSLSPEKVEFGKIRNATLRRQLQSQYADLHGRQSVVAQQGVGRLIDAGSRPYYMHVIDPSGPIDPITMFWQQTTFHLPAGVTRPNLSDDYMPSGSPLRVAARKRIAEQLQSGMPSGSAAVLDIETTGLDMRRHGIWQITVRDAASDAVQDFYFDTAMPGSARGGSVLEMLAGGKARASSFANMEKVVSLLESYDNVIGQNVSFDIEGLYQNFLAKTRDDARFEGLADRIAAKFMTTDDAGARVLGRNVIDTLQIGRGVLSNMEVADELQQLGLTRLGKASPFSLTNILLETNLLELAQQRHGMDLDSIKTAIDTGLHSSFVDTQFEKIYNAELERAMYDDGDNLLRYVPGGQMGLERADAAYVRGKVLQSGAVTPFSALAEDQIDTDVMQWMRDSQRQYIFDFDWDAAGGKQSFFAMTPLEHQVIQARLRGPQGSQALADDIIQSRRAVAPMQAAFDAVAADTADVGRAFPLPSMEQYGPMMDAIHQARLPYASLGPVERMAAMALGQVSGDVLDQSIGSMTLNQTIHGVGTRGSASRFVGATKTRAIVSFDLLKAAEGAGVFGGRTSIASGDQFYRLSPFEWTRKDADVSINFLLADDADRAALEADELSKFIKGAYANPESRLKYRLTQQFMEDMQSQIDAGTWGANLRKYGLQIGTLLDRANGTEEHRKAVRTAHDIVVRVSGEAVDMTDRNSLSLMVSLPREFDDTGRAQISAPVLTKVAEDEAMAAAHVREARLAAAMRDDLYDKSGNPVLRRQLTDDSILDPVPGARLADSARNFYRANKTTSRVAIAATAAAAGYYLYSRRQESRSYFDQTFERQPTEQADWYSRYQQEMSVGMEGQYNRPNPLDTAGVVQTLDRRKIGHHRMGSNKNNYLFGGDY